MPHAPSTLSERRRRRARARRSPFVPALALGALLLAASLVALLAAGAGPEVLARDLGVRASASASAEDPQAAAARERAREAARERRARRARAARRERAAERREAARQVANGPPGKAWTHRDLGAVRWRSSTPLGTPQAGRLSGGVLLPARGDTYVTWDPVLRRTPNRAARRYATAETVRTVLEVAAAYAKANPGAARMIVGDLSRPQGGDFGVRFGDLGDGKAHVSHQNGLDVDIYYPRSDGAERGMSRGGPDTLCPLDRGLAQDLVDRFVAAGAELVLVGSQTGLTGPPGVVKVEPRHNDHMHVRLPAR